MYDVQDLERGGWSAPDPWSDDNEPFDHRRHRRRVQRAVFLSLVLVAITSVIGVCAATEDGRTEAADDVSWTMPVARP